MKAKEIKQSVLKKRWMIASVVCIAGVALCVLCALRARTLLQMTLDGRRDPVQIVEAAKTYSAFQLKEQMNLEQQNARVNGWLTIADMQEVELHTDRGVLKGTAYGAIGSEREAPWAIVLHGGMGTDRMQVQDVACELSLNGYRVLTPDGYAHGKSDGAFTSLGLREAEDVKAWVNWILLQYPDAKIVLYGVAEGAAAMLAALGAGLPDAVCAAAADSAYLCVEWRALDLLRKETERVGERDWKLFCLAYQILFGREINEGDFKSIVAGINLPLLFIHGTGDQEVPAWHSEDLVIAAGSNAKLLFVEGASHGMARFADPAAYYHELMTFYAAGIGQ